MSAKSAKNLGTRTPRTISKRCAARVIFSRWPGHQMFADVASGKQRTADTLWGRISPHPQFLKASMTGSDGHHYTLVTELPPGQNALFGPNGVPGLGIAIAVLSSGLVCYLLA